MDPLPQAALDQEGEPFQVGWAVPSLSHLQGCRKAQAYPGVVASCRLGGGSTAFLAIQWLML